MGVTARGGSMVGVTKGMTVGASGRTVGGQLGDGAAAKRRK